MATTSKAPKSPTDTVPTSASPTQSANYVASQSKGNPLSVIMLMCIGQAQQVTDEQRLLLSQFILGSVKATASHITSLARFAGKRVHIEYTGLVLKCAGQIAFESNGEVSLPRVRNEIEKATGVKCANRRDGETGYDDSYKSYLLEDVITAVSYLWDNYGKGGMLNDGLIDRANDRARVEREARA